MSMAPAPTVLDAMTSRFPGLTTQGTLDRIPTIWSPAARTHDLLRYLKYEIDRPYRFLYDLSAIDERLRRNRGGQPRADFTVVYHLFSYDRNEFIRVKTPLEGEYPSLATIVDIWPMANWYEREVWDMFGIRFKGHPNLKRLLMYEEFQGHALRKDYPFNKRQPLIGPRDV